jgi:hypothetical protein
MSTRNIPGSEGRPARKADVTAICEPIVYKMWEPQHLTALWASTARYRDTFTLPSADGGLYMRDASLNYNFRPVVCESRHKGVGPW